MNQVASLCLIIVILLAAGWYITLLKSENFYTPNPAGANYENASHSPS